MIVSCPACNTQFNADPALFAPDGRKVRCAKCAHVWRVGADGMPAPEPEAPAPEPEAPAESEVAADVPAAPAVEPEPPAVEAETPEAAEPPQEENAAGTPEGGLIMSARELLEREETAGQPALSPEGAGGAGEAAAQGEEAAVAVEGDEAAAAAEGEARRPVLLSEDSEKKDSDTGQSAEQAALANLAAKRKEQRGKRQKGGRKFKIFVLVLFLIVIALLAAAYFNGRFGPGGVDLGQNIPAVSDVPPSPKDVGAVDSKPAEGGHIIGGKE